MKDGRILEDELAVANAHTLGATPWKRDDYIRKFMTLSEGIVSRSEAERFLNVVQKLPVLAAGDLHQLELSIPVQDLQCNRVEGIFNFGQLGADTGMARQPATLMS